MKKIIAFTVVSCLLATSMAFAATKSSAKKAPKDDATAPAEVAKTTKKKAKKPVAKPAPATTGVGGN